MQGAVIPVLEGRRLNMYASRNLSKCTKDCLCLFVCPTGATDTETGQIDSGRCLDGCRLCVDACPSKAIFLVMNNYPEPAPKDPGVAASMAAVSKSRYEQEKTAEAIAGSVDEPGLRRLAEALRRSLRIAAEDYAREAGFMLPQARNVQVFLKELQD